MRLHLPFPSTRTNYVPEAERQRILTTQQLAKKAFAEHTLLQTLDHDHYREWCCGKPGTSCYYFCVLAKPGHLLLTGDIGTLVVTREYDMVAWARNAIDDLHYFSSKVPSEFKVKEFDAHMASEWVLEERRGDSMQEEFSVDLLSALEDGEHFFVHRLIDSGYLNSNDWPDFSNFTHGFLWQVEVIKWLLARV